MKLVLKIFRQTLTEVETIVKLILSGLLNFSCGGGWVGGGWVVGGWWLGVGWVLKMELKLLKLSTTLKLKLKLKFGSLRRGYQNVYKNLS